MDSLSSALPTLHDLGAIVSPNINAKQVAVDWFRAFAAYIQAKDYDGISTILSERPFWRDILALTWDFRTFDGVVRIKRFLADCLGSGGSAMAALKLKESSVELQRPFSDVAWIQAMFYFETNVGIGSGVVRLVPTANGDWRGHCIFTNLEDLKGFREQIGALRNYQPNNTWAEQRRLEVSFAESDPVVLICGGGQSGLELAARLKSLNVPCLVIEKNPRIGDNWRNRYESLCLHDPVWFHHMPYIPFPPTWPVYTPGTKLGDWLEFYANALELNIWTSATVTSVSQGPSKTWDVNVTKNDGSVRVFHVNHFILATGIGAGLPNIPSYPGMDSFTGHIMHSTAYKTAKQHLNKKIAIIGSCCSAFDIAVDYYNHGIDVTMIQRSPTYVMTTKNGWKTVFENGLYWENSPPTEIADTINVSFPHALQECMAERHAKQIAEADRDVLDGLRTRGFKLNLNYKDAKFLFPGCTRAGGYYLDVGGSQLVIDGKVKLKSDSPIERFTSNGLRFEDGTELAADVVVFATGVGDARQYIRKLCGDQIADKCEGIWNIDEDGEYSTCWRDLGLPGLWYMMGNLGLCRFYSKRTALQIKAMEENVFGPRYTLS